MYPFLRIARDLLARGHRVTMLGLQAHAAAAALAGVPFHGLGTEDDYRATLDHPDVWHPRKGFGVLVSDFVKNQTGLQGVLTGRMTSDSTSLNDLSKQVTSTNLRLSQTEARLKAQFAAMETALQNSQSQQAWLAGQIASLR